MAARFWVGGAGTWNTTTTHWSATSGGASGASVPTSSDDVTFDTNSGLAGGVTVCTISGTRTCNNLTVSVDCGFGGTLTPILQISGSLSFSPNNSNECTWNASGTAVALQWVGTGSSTYADTAGGVGQGPLSGISGLTINGVGGTLTLNNNIPSTVGTLTLTNGTLALSSMTMIATTLALGSGTKGLNFGSGSLTISGTSCNFNTNVSGMTITPGTGALLFTSASATTFAGGGLTFGNVMANATTGILTVQQSNTYAQFIIINAASVKFTISTTQTCTNFVCEGASGATNTIQSTAAATAWNLSVASGTVVTTFTSIKDCHAAGGASFFAGANSTNVSGNTGYTFTSPGFLKGSCRGGSWSAVAAWADGAVPVASDDVKFDATTAIPVVANGSPMAIDGTSGSPSLCRSLDCTGYINTLTQTGTFQLNIGDASGGDLKLVAGMTYVPASTAVIKFVSTTSGRQITSAGKNLSTWTFDGVGGVWQLQDAPGTANVGAVTLTNGSLDLNSKNISSASFSSSNSNTRSLTFGTATWTLGASTAAIWDISTATGMTLSAASGTVTFGGTTTSQTFAGGGLTYGTVSCTTLTTANHTISGANTFGALTLSCGAGTKTTTSGYKLSANQTVTGTFTSNGSSTILRNFIYSDTVGTPRTISAATVTVTHTDIRDITGAGAGSWNFSGLTSNANGNAGGNSGITFTAPKNCFMKTAVSVNWSSSNWFTASGGSVAIVPAMPLIHDTVKFDANSVTAASKTITLDEARLPSVDWTGVLNTPAFSAGANAWEAYGSIIFVSGMTHTGAVGVSLMGRGSYSLDGGTLTWPSSSLLTVNAPGGTYSLSRNFASNSGLTVTNGTLSGAFTTNFTTLTVNGGTFTLGGTCTLTGAAAVSSGILDMNSQNITGCTTIAVSGGTLKLSGQFNGSAGITVSGGAITDAGPLGELKGTTASFTAGTSVVRKLTLSSTFAMSATANLTFPTGGNATWATSWTITGTTCTLDFKGVPNFVNGALTVGSPYVPSLEGY